jgi:hypothetical protein
MMTQKPLFAVPIKFGSFAGIMSVITFMMLYFLDFNPFVESRMMDVVLIPIFLFFGIKDFRDVKNGRVLHYWQGMTVGVITYLLMGLISFVFIMIFIELEPQALTDYITNRLALMEASKVQFLEQLGEETYNTAMVDLSKTSGLDLAIDDFLKKSVIGLMLTIMISVILRKQPK